MFSTRRSTQNEVGHRVSISRIEFLSLITIRDTIEVFDAVLGTSQLRFGPAVDGIVPALIARFKGIPIARTGSGIPCSSNTLGIGRRRRRCDYQTHGPLTWCRTTTMTTAATVATSRRLVATSPSTHRTAKGWVTVQCSKQQG